MAKRANGPPEHNDEAVLVAVRFRVLTLREQPEPLVAPDEIARAERELGFPLPSLLRLLLTRIGNGGFGPGPLMGLEGGATDDQGDTLDKWYLDSRRLAPKDDKGSTTWPRGLVPLCTWGCGAYSCVDCLSPGSPIIRFDPSGGLSNVSRCLSPEGYTLREWLKAWADGDEILARGLGRSRVSP
ncbi:MAG: SMI1/KNR4 family protein [Planctomycetota bacterium]